MPSKLYDQSNPSWCLEAVPRQSKKWLSLVTLRFGALLCQLICVICFSWALAEHEKGIAYIDGLGSGWSSINLGTSSYAFLWSATFLTVVAFNRRVHPGIGIAFDLLAFLAQMITVAFYLNEFAQWQTGGYPDDTEEAKRLYGVECFALAMMLLGLSFNLILLIRSSVACDVERKEAKSLKNRRKFGLESP
ncbi:hypothetical protein N7468_005858 [Penicillium chermesinum]|uniref:MARVEL domain-containing protein n=1 Tax=Penicillium chermesinum TaxID=63820 RepID=A0A9W9P2F5_9EURO|nr:uncharacterized protein N7468_005858 [Penicillium chermesinum]KAJ5232902.1 hypothetical protein N7468_005858 [Penicillium chermesinum]KAJ6172553.1 hypothetical protein N7470_001620 [Penicillium chermesinum]